MRIVLMGTGPFAVPSFEALCQHDLEIAAVICRPEVQAPSAKKAPPPSPVRLWAESQGLPVHTPASINDSMTIDWLRSLCADLFVVCDYGQILSSDALSTAGWGGINLHGSLLPRHRGAAPVQWTILSGDSVAGVTVIHMTPGLDAGPILASTKTDLIPDENAQELESRLSQIGVETTLRALESLRNWDTSTPSPGTLQDRALATKAPRLAKGDAELDPSFSCRLLDRQVRGLQPWPGCFANIECSSGSTLRLLIQRARPIPLEFPLPDHPIGALLVGTTLQSLQANAPSLFNTRNLSDVKLAVVVRDGLLALEQVQPAGKKSMAAADFACGYAKQDWMRVACIGTAKKLLERMAHMAQTETL
ncbi:methionyl-tRNA formyltransferase [Pirellulaceae bacterium SH467]